MKERAFDKIVDLLRQQTGVDFSLYRQATLRRRVHRRMSAHKLKSLEHYSRFLRSHPGEASTLFNDFLIQVTSFFRDPDSFKLLAKNFLTPMMAAKPKDEPVRVWVPACATGEEVYSLAIMLAEIAQQKKDSRPIQIFGTDISQAALEKARAGFYPETIKKDIAPERLRRFFEYAPGGYRIHENIRNMCVFARQNLAGDPPFSNLDMISCRNVLIYFNPVLQQRLMPMFHFALRPNGLLMLGTSETIGKSTNLFAVAEKRARLYSKKIVGPRVVLPEMRFLPSVQNQSQLPQPRKAPLPANPSSHLKAGELREALEKAFHKSTGLKPDNTRIVPLTIPHSPDKVYLVVVDPSEADKGKSKGGNGKAGDGEVTRLRRELFKAKETLQAVVEQEEVANEELRAANEEIVSSNEELQSTNEELETAKEELQAANEELAMLNNELQSRNTELERANAVSGHFMAIVESSDDAIISKNLNSIIQTWNVGAEKIFGYKAEEVIGKPVTILIPPGQDDEEPRIIARMRAGERIDHYETIRRRKDGTLINISLTVSPIRSPSGEIIGASKIARDITQKKRSELELQRARDEAEKANRAKDYFLAALSHELRTPLSPVLLVASDAAANTELAPGIRASFDMIRRNVEMEARLIDDLLDVTRITSGKLTVEKRNVNIQALLEVAISMVRNEIDQKEIVLKENFEASHSMIVGDTVRLNQVFLNVLKNAIKFTPPKGTITVEAKAEKGQYCVSISDTGIGMTTPELENVFDAFKQGDHSQDARRFGGLGLGLTISKNLVELHGGNIEAASTGRNQGATFTIRFPLANWKEQPARADSKWPSSRPSRPARILVIEDDDSTRAVLTKILSDRNHKVTTAVSARSATALAAENEFDLIISDIGLPDGNGYDLFKKLQKQLPSAKGIALTGFGMEDDRNRGKDSGFHAHLTKPVRIQSLESALSDVLAD